MSDTIKRMVDRFLNWRLPRDFGPDGGISFKPSKPYEGDEYGNSWWPVGTNLFTADQAQAMFRHCVGDAIERLERENAALRAALETARVDTDAWEATAQSHYREVEALKADLAKVFDVREWEREVEALNAKIDSLMLEFCPDEMTPEQLKKWEESQVRSGDEK